MEGKNKMVDIMDMEDIFNKILGQYFIDQQNYCRSITKKLIKEVSDFVEAQQTIACVNCKGYKFKNLKERWQVG